MPLIQGKSKGAFSSNVGAEMNAGKPQSQALAIAYAIKRKNAKKGMCTGGMAGYSSGGEVMGSSDQSMFDAGDIADAIIAKHKEPVSVTDPGYDDYLSDDGDMEYGMADGGIVEDSEDPKARRKKMLAGIMAAHRKY